MVISQNVDWRLTPLASITIQFDRVTFTYRKKLCVPSVYSRECLH